MEGPERGAAMHTLKRFGLFVKDVSGPSMFAANLLSADQSSGDQIDIQMVGCLCPLFLGVLPLRLSWRGQ